MVIESIEERKYTVAEYFELEHHSELSHEFYYGTRTLKPSKSKIGNTITLNIVEIINKPFYKKGYEVYANTIKVEVNKGNIYYCPDVVVTPITDNSDAYLVLIPEIVVDIASKNAVPINTLTKLKEYKKLPSIQYYIIASQDEMEVTVYTRSGDKWTVDLFDLPNDIVDLPLFDTSFSLADMYDAVKINGQLFLKD
jgi:Uma2 family endonuclease